MASAIANPPFAEASCEVVDSLPSPTSEVDNRFNHNEQEMQDALRLLAKRNNRTKSWRRSLVGHIGNLKNTNASPNHKPESEANSNAHGTAHEGLSSNPSSPSPCAYDDPAPLHHSAPIRMPSASMPYGWAPPPGASAFANTSGKPVPDNPPTLTVISPSGLPISVPARYVGDQDRIPWHLRKYEIYQPPMIGTHAPPRYFNHHLLSKHDRERAAQGRNLVPINRRGGIVGFAGLAGLSVFDPPDLLNAGLAASHRSLTVSQFLHLIQGSSSADKEPPGQIRTTVRVVPSEMTSLEMFNCLLENGCTDLSSRINFSHYPSVAVAGGSFGDIWRGKMDTGDQVAVKCLRFHTVVEHRKKGLKRAMRESYMWSRVKHPNVQQLMGIIMFQERLGMVSLWMENGNLQHYIQKNPDADRYKLCREVTGGVSYLHTDINMVHGDIKALNVLVSRDGVAKISDFDHSILSDCTLAFSSTTNVGGGTLRWMAPELLSSSKGQDPAVSERTKRTDVYALAMTMLEIITGDVPYAEYQHDMGIYRAIDRKDPPERPQELQGPHNQPERMWQLLMKCWNHEPTARPDAPSVLKLLQELSIEAPAV